MTSLLPGITLTLILFAYIFWPDNHPFFQRDKTRADYLRERKDVIYDNLRDLNFEYLAGKHPEPDYAEQRASLEDEAARVVAELDRLDAAPHTRLAPHTAGKPGTPSGPAAGSSRRSHRH